MDLNALLQKIPKPVLVVGILVIAIILFVLNDPLKDECEVQTSIFEKKTEGILSAMKKNRKIQYAQINYWRDRCRNGNSIGSCDDYFEGLRVVASNLRDVKDNCQIKYGEQNANFTQQITQGLQIMSLVAWGEAPPPGIAERIGWLTESHIRTFCYLKKTFILLAGDESYIALRSKVYREYPGEWSEEDKKKIAEKEATAASGDESRRFLDENRPRALKSVSNPSGKLTQDEVFERSIFSIRCDMYM
ncbi:hypothetical protein K2P97_13410 [bacterium]|nr:hypothetical protein [bacterium]